MSKKPPGSSSSGLSSAKETTPRSSSSAKETTPGSSSSRQLKVESNPAVFFDDGKHRIISGNPIDQQENERLRKASLEDYALSRDSKDNTPGLTALHNTLTGYPGYAIVQEKIGGDWVSTKVYTDSRSQLNLSGVSAQGIAVLGDPVYIHPLAVGRRSDYLSKYVNFMTENHELFGCQYTLFNCNYLLQTKDLSAIFNLFL